MKNMFLRIGMNRYINNYVIKNIAFHYAIVRRPTGYSEPICIFEEMKFVRVMEGSGIWHINGKDYTVGEGDILIFCKDDERYIKNVTSKEGFLIADIRFLPVTVYPMQNCVRFFFERTDAFSNIIPRDTPYYQKLLQSFDAIDAEAKSNQPWRNESISNIIVSMAISISRIFVTEETKSVSLNNSGYETVCKAMAYIQSNLQNDLSREAIAKKLYISPSYLSRIFKEYNGVCLQDYIVRARVKNAAELIKKGTKPIDAGFESGFSSSSGFYRAFHDVMGESPRDFQKREISFNNSDVSEILP